MEDFHDHTDLLDLPRGQIEVVVVSRLLELSEKRQGSGIFGIYHWWKVDPGTLADCLKVNLVTSILSSLGFSSEIPIPWPYDEKDLRPFLLHRIGNIRNAHGRRIASIDSWQDIDPISLGLALSGGITREICNRLDIDASPPRSVDGGLARNGKSSGYKRRLPQISDLSERAERIVAGRRQSHKSSPKNISYPGTRPELLEFLARFVSGLRNSRGHPVTTVKEWRAAHYGSYAKAVKNDLVHDLSIRLNLEYSPVRAHRRS